MSTKKTSTDLINDLYMEKPITGEIIDALSQGIEATNNFLSASEYDVKPNELKLFMASIVAGPHFDIRNYAGDYTFDKPSDMLHKVLTVIQNPAGLEVEGHKVTYTINAQGHVRFTYDLHHYDIIFQGFQAEGTQGKSPDLRFSGNRTRASPEAGEDVDVSGLQKKIETPPVGSSKDSWRLIVGIPVAVGLSAGVLGFCIWGAVTRWWNPAPIVVPRVEVSQQVIFNKVSETIKLDEATLKSFMDTVRDGAARLNNEQIQKNPSAEVTLDTIEQNLQKAIDDTVKMQLNPKLEEAVDIPIEPYSSQLGTRTVDSTESRVVAVKAQEITAQLKNTVQHQIVLDEYARLAKEKQLSDSVNIYQAHSVSGAELKILKGLIEAENTVTRLSGSNDKTDKELEELEKAKNSVDNLNEKFRKALEERGKIAAASEIKNAAMKSDELERDSRKSHEEVEKGVKTFLEIALAK